MLVTCMLIKQLVNREIWPLKCYQKQQTNKTTTTTTTNRYSITVFMLWIFQLWSWNWLTKISTGIIHVQILEQFMITSCKVFYFPCLFSQLLLFKTAANGLLWYKLNTLHNYYGIFIDNICYFRIPLRACQTLSAGDWSSQLWLCLN